MSGLTKVATISNATGQTYLGSGVGARVGSLLVQFDFSSSPAANHSITIKARTQRDGSAIDQPLIACAYLNKFLGDVVSTAITADALILVDAAGCDIWADVTTVTTGSVRFTSIQLAG
jgi:hypothetical protein